MSGGTSDRFTQSPTSRHQIPLRSDVYAIVRQVIATLKREGIDIEDLLTDLFIQALTSLTASGLLVKSANDAFARQIVSSKSHLTIANADGVSGNPDLNVATTFLPNGIKGTSGQIVVTDNTDGSVTISISGSFTLDHGVLTGLGDDDHIQYHNDSRANTWLANGHETTYNHTDIALNTNHRNLTSGNPHNVQASDLVTGTPQSGTYTFGGGASGDVASMTFENGILVGVTLVP